MLFRNLALSLCLFACATGARADGPATASVPASAFASAPAALPAPAAKPYRIMMILYRGATDAERGFMDYFRRHNIPVEFIVRDAQADNARIAGFVREARELRPDLIYTFGTTVTAEVAGQVGKVDPARNITDIPVVFNIVADPVGAGLVTSMAASGRNLTGASHMVPLGDQMKALQAMRSTRTMAVVYNPQERNSALAVQQLEQIAPRYGMTLEMAPVPDEGRGKVSEAALAALMRQVVAKKPQFIYLPSDSLLIKHARTVVQAAYAAQIPVFSATEAPIRQHGALLGVVSTYANVGELAASKAQLILSGQQQASQIPIELLNRFTYLVNMASARKLGVFPPLSVVKLAELISPAEAADARE
jgi:putative ABC transport system substrate-binding protein